MTRKGVHKVPDFSRRSGPQRKGVPADPNQQVNPGQRLNTQRNAPAAPKPHSTSQKSGRRHS